MDDRFAERRQAVAEDRARRSLRRAFRLVLVAAVIAGVAYLFQSPVLSVDRVEVEGVSRSETESVLEGLEIVSGEPMVFLDIDEARAAIEADPWVESVVVERSWPTTVVVEVEERSPVAVIEGSMVAVDGVVLPGDPVAGLASVVMESEVVNGAHRAPEMLGALEFLDALGPGLRPDAAVGTGEEGLFAFVSGYRIRLGRAVDMTAKARALVSVLEQDPPEGSEITLFAPERPAVMAPDAVTPTEQEGDDPRPEDEG